MSHADVVLVSMPFGNILAPSVGLSLLKAVLVERGRACHIQYFTFDFAKRVGTSFYLDIADDREPSIHELGGEWVFAGGLFDPSPERDEAYLQNVLRERTGWNTETGVDPVPESQIRKLVRARVFVNGFLDACLDTIVDRSPPIVGFTSVFQQHVASLALAKRVKKALPQTFIVFGGANAEGVMGVETLRQFDFVDAAVSGEGEIVFPELVDRVLAGGPIDGLPGVRTQRALSGVTHAPSITTMDDLPYPDYSDFLRQFRKSGLARTWEPRIYFETSRGCWWGAKQHCTFCGLNGESMAYRSKSPNRVVDELEFLSEHYRTKDVHVVDNILDMDYFKTVLPELARRRLGIELFYETKANLKKEQLRSLRAAGVVEIQPGIESFSDAVLGLMRKGVSALQNIQLLKWCRELGLTPYWNVLWGFPGEPAEDYARMARLVPLLTHLEPPAGIAGIRLDRFSPNFFDATHLGFTDVSPLPAYEHVYPFERDALSNLAYHFTFRYADGRDVNTYIRPLLDELERWKSSPDAGLFMVDAGRGHDAWLVIWDLRPGSERPLNVLSGLERELYLECDAIRAHGSLVHRPGAGGDAVTRVLDDLVRRGLTLEQDGRYLSLATALGDHQPPRPVVNRFFAVAKTIGEPTRHGLRVPLARVNGSDGWLSAATNDRVRCGRAFPRHRSRLLSPGQFSMDGNRDLLVEFRRRDSRKES